MQLPLHEREQGNRRGRVLSIRLTATYLPETLPVKHAADHTSKADLFVAPDGNDDDSGTAKKPFATLARARNAVREALKRGRKRDLLLLIRGGTYRIIDTVVFLLADSAAEGYAVTYAAYTDEKPVFTAGVPITQWEKLDTPPQGLPKKAHGKVWSAPLPQGIEACHTLYERSSRLPRARGPGFRPTNRSKSWHAEDQHLIHWPQAAVRDWSNLKGAEVVLVTAAPWTMNILPIASVDQTKHVVRTAIRGTYALTRPGSDIYQKVRGSRTPSRSLIDPASGSSPRYRAGYTYGLRARCPATTLWPLH